MRGRFLAVLAILCMTGCSSQGVNDTFELTLAVTIAASVVVAGFVNGGWK